MQIMGSSLEDRGLKGKVKFTEEKTYYAIENSEKGEKGGFKSGKFLSFNEDGYLLLEVYDSKDYSSKETYIYDSNGNLIEESSSIINKITTYKYNSNNHIIEENCYERIECLGENISFNTKIKGNLICSTVYDFDSNGALIQGKKYNSDKCLTKYTIYKYDSDGKIKEENVYDSYRRLEERTIYKYDSNGNMIEANAYDSNGVFVQKSIYEYNSDGEIEECREFDREGKLISSKKYDLKGNIIEKNTYYKNGKLREKELFKYDLEKKTVEKNTYDSERNFKKKEIYKYNSKGNEIEYNSFNLEEMFDWKCVTSQYEYDQRNNWIKRIINDGDNYKVTTRKIIYYGEEDNTNFPNWDSQFFKDLKE